MVYEKALDYPLNLIAAVLELDFNKGEDADILAEISIIDDIAGSVEYILYTLMEQERKVLKLRFIDNLTYEQIGKEFGVTRERIRQAVMKALRKLRHPNRSKYLKYGVKDIIQGTKESYFERYCNLEKQLLELCKLNEKAADEVISSVQLKDKYRSELLESLNLSVRSRNCLKRAGCSTIKDIAALGFDGLHKVRNLGKRGCDEVIKTLAEYGYTIEVPDNEG